jgi:hypothetical protein
MTTFKPGQTVKVTQNPRAPKEDREVIGQTGHVGDPAYSRLGYLRVYLDKIPAPFPGLPWLIHPENIKAL